MLFCLIARHYMLWHYLAAPREILHIWRNFIWFIDRYFSLGELARSFFSPWRRITEPRHKRFSFEDWASAFIVNTLSRCIGMIMRSILIILGVVSITVLTVCTAIVFSLWIIAPALILLGIVYGTVLVIS